MSTWVIIGLAVIVLHLLVGFGWLAYKLSPKKGDKKTDKTVIKAAEEKNTSKRENN